MINSTHWLRTGIAVVGTGVLMVVPGALAHAEIPGGHGTPATPVIQQVDDQPNVMPGTGPDNIPILDDDNIGKYFVNPQPPPPSDRDSIETIQVPPECEAPLWMDCPPGAL